MNDKIVYIVHCVDTEGPLCESLLATFERVKNVFGITMAPSKKNLKMLQNGEGIPEQIRSLVMEFVSEERLSYNSNWKMIDKMLDEVMSDLTGLFWMMLGLRVIPENELWGIIPSLSIIRRKLNNLVVTRMKCIGIFTRYHFLEKRISLRTIFHIQMSICRY